MAPNRIAVRESDLAEPRLVVAHLNRLYDQTYSLLSQITALGQSVGKAPAGSGLTDNERQLIQALARGSTESSVPATKPVLPTFTALPPTSTATVGELINIGGVVYLFDGSNWNSITAAASPHNVLSATHADTVAAAAVRGDLIIGNSTPKWARLARGAASQLLRMNAGATDPEWGAVVDAMLSANVALLNGANAWSAAQTFNALAKMNGAVEFTTFSFSGTQTLSNEPLISINTSGGVATAKMPAAPSTGKWYFITDDQQNAGTNNITLDGNGHNVLGAATKLINTNGGAAWLFYNGTQWTGKIW